MTFPNDDPGLRDKVAIVAGGGAKGEGIGNGRAAAMLLARSGTKVLVVDLDRQLAQNTVDMIAGEGGTALALGADLTKPSECKRMVEAAVDTWGRLDFLDNNIGISSKGTVVDEPLETWQRMMQVNVEVMFLTSKHAIPAMKKTAGKGAIVNISSRAPAAMSPPRPRSLGSPANGRRRCWATASASTQ